MKDSEQALPIPTTPKLESRESNVRARPFAFAAQNQLIGAGERSIYGAGSTGFNGNDGMAASEFGGAS